MSQTSNFFSDMALARFVAAQNRTVEKIVCHLFINFVDHNNPLQVIENVQLQFKDGNVLTISLNDEGNGLDAVEFKFDAENHVIPEEFRDKIKFLPVDASFTTLWKEVIGLDLLAVRLTRDQEHYKSDAVVLDFGKEKREITLGPLDGLMIDYFEE
jgi:hypothetical protein